MIQEDGAPSHSSRYQQEVFDIWEIVRFLWLVNSPDLNIIEPCWFWMKRRTAEKGTIKLREQLRGMDQLLEGNATREDSGMDWENQSSYSRGY